MPRRHNHNSANPGARSSTPARPSCQLRYPDCVMETIATTPTLTSERPAALDEKTLNAYRRLGYLLADLDPMNRIEPEAQPGLEDSDPATAAYPRHFYCGTTGVEDMHIPD